MSTNKEIGEKLLWFTKSEENLKARLRALGHTVPKSLEGWQFWIGDPVIYINRLRSHVEDAEAKAAKGGAK